MTILLQENDCVSLGEHRQLSVLNHEFHEESDDGQLDVPEPLAIAAGTTAASHIKIMAVRRENVIAKIANVNQKAADANSKIPPSAHGMYGGDAAELEKAVKFARDLGGSVRQPFQGTSSTQLTPTTTTTRGVVVASPLEVVVPSGVVLEVSGMSEVDVKKKLHRGYQTPS